MILFTNKDNVEFFAIPYSQSFPKLRTIRNANNLIEIICSDSESLTVEIKPNVRDVLTIVIRSLWGKCPVDKMAKNGDSYYKLPASQDLSSVSASMSSINLDGTYDSQMIGSSIDYSIEFDEITDESKRQELINNHK